MEEELPGRSCLQRHPPRHQTLRAGQLEALLRLSCPKSDRSEDALPQSFGDRIASRDPDRQTAEVHIRVALMNRFNALGTAEVERFT